MEAGSTRSGSSRQTWSPPPQSSHRAGPEIRDNWIQQTGAGQM
jgi:hypothetical protein